MMITTIAGAILAGGKNTRMGGKNKAFLEINDTPIIHRTINIFKEIFKEILIVTNSPDDYKLFRQDCNIITDIIKDRGPLGGIHSALSNSSKGAVFFIACDMPFLHNELIKQQISCFINPDFTRASRRKNLLALRNSKNFQDKVPAIFQIAGGRGNPKQISNAKSGIKEGGDAFVPRIGESIEPLHAIYRKKLADEMSFFLKTSANYSIREFLKTVRATYMDLENNFFNKNMFKNMNTPEDLKNGW